MGFVTKSRMMSNYTLLSSKEIEQNKTFQGLKVPNDLHLDMYLTPKGILIEIVKDELDAHSVDQYVIFSKLIEIRYDIPVEDISVVDFEHKDGWEDEE